MKTILAVAASAVALTGCLYIDVGDVRRDAEVAAAEAALAAAEAVAAAAEAVSSLDLLYTASIADPRRPEVEVARDPLRKPFEMLDFVGVMPGDRIADIRPEEGYFSRLFAPVVGADGQVYAFVPNQTSARENAHADTLASDYPGIVTRITGDLDTMTFPEPLDIVFSAQEYHDFHIERFNADPDAMNRAIFAALKPGGLYIVLDHEAAPGAGITAVESLHRIEGAYLRREVEAAGFVYEGQSYAVRNSADDHSLSVFNEAIRGKTDQFVYRFRKPF